MRSTPKRRPAELGLEIMDFNFKLLDEYIIKMTLDGGADELLGPADSGLGPPSERSCKVPSRTLNFTFNLTA